jgi:hypothetical protein
MGVNNLKKVDKSIKQNKIELCIIRMNQNKKYISFRSVAEECDCSFSYLYKNEFLNGFINNIIDEKIVKDKSTTKKENNLSDLNTILKDLENEREILKIKEQILLDLIF